MTGMRAYYASRALISIAFGLLFTFTGSPWWMGVLMGALAFGFFLWAPRSGRYSVHPEMGATALRRDEHTQVVNDRAARNAFVIMGLALAGLSIYFGAINLAFIPVTLLNYTLILGVVVYFLSDLILRRKGV
jgi:nitrogen fixation-related uncharacterized protein